MFFGALASAMFLVRLPRVGAEMREQSITTLNCHRRQTMHFRALNEVLPEVIANGWVQTLQYSQDEFGTI